MAFLSKGPRFGPDLDKPRKIQPNPTTYDPAHVTIATAATSSRTTNRYGTIGPHHDKALHRIACASPAAVALAAADPSPASSPHSIRRKSPSPWTYTPTIQGQFDRIFTTSDLEKQQKQRLEDARRTTTTRVASDGSSQQKPHQVQQLELGPGEYELDKDWNLESVAVAFAFGKEPRRGILDCVVAQRDLHSHTKRLGKYSKRLSSDQRRRSESALLPLRRVATSTSTQVADLSKELATSYAELEKSNNKLERKLASPAVRSVRFQRFRGPSSSGNTSSSSDIESFRRGPGSYFDKEASPASNSNQYQNQSSMATEALPLDEPQRKQLETLLRKAASSTALTAQPLDTTTSTTFHTKKSSFGRVQHRDMLTSMAQAGHLSAVALDATLGPGVYETSCSLDVPTHSILYKKKIPTRNKVKNAKTSNQTSSTSTRNTAQEEIETGDSNVGLARERWLAFRHGPQWTPSSQPETATTVKHR